MDLSDIDKLIQDREGRIEKRKEDGTLFEEEFKKEENADERLSQEVEQQKAAMQQKMDEKIPPCPQCGVKMTFMPEQSAIVCQDCGVGMRV